MPPLPDEIGRPVGKLCAPSVTRNSLKVGDSAGSQQAHELGNIRFLKLWPRMLQGDQGEAEVELARAEIGQIRSAVQMKTTAAEISVQIARLTDHAIGNIHADNLFEVRCKPTRQPPKATTEVKSAIPIGQAHALSGQPLQYRVHITLPSSEKITFCPSPSFFFGVRQNHPHGIGFTEFGPVFLIFLKVH